MQTSITYPQFRKYLNERNFFKIISDKEWEEIQVMSSKYSIHQFKVNIFPDRNYLYDMTFDYEKNWIAIDETEYENIKRNIK
jgi:hypothetical protein